MRGFPPIRTESVSISQKRIETTEPICSTKMKVLPLVLSLALAATGVRGDFDYCPFATKAFKACLALECPLKVDECTGNIMSEDVDTCDAVNAVCTDAETCCPGNKCGYWLESLIVNCVPDSVCAGNTCSLPVPDNSKIARGCETVEVIDACGALNRTCSTETDNGDTREFCDTCVPEHVANFISPTLGDCFPISAINYTEFEETVEDITKDDADAAERANLLLDIALFVAAHNSAETRPDYFLELNLLAVLTPDEINFRNGVRNVTAVEEDLPLFDIPATRGRRLQSSVDWSKTGAVTSVKNQAACGCCWANAVTAAAEAAVWINSGEAYQESLSFQQLISCDLVNYGCNGGNVIEALKYMEDNSIGGVTSLKQYPFTDSEGTTTEDCNLEDKTLEVDVKKLGLAMSSLYPPEGNHDERLERVKDVLTRSPMAVIMKTSCYTFQAYGSGIMTDDGDCACDGGDCVDHAVFLVGYDDTTSPPSFKIKNSWGTGWGENGYFRIAQTVNDDKPYGLFALLYQGSGVADAINTTVADNSAATSMKDGSVATATVLSVISSAILAFLGW